jgi:hypothetical protein
MIRILGILALEGELTINRAVDGVEVVASFRSAWSTASSWRRLNSHPNGNRPDYSGLIVASARSPSPSSGRRSTEIAGRS